MNNDYELKVSCLFQNACLDSMWQSIHSQQIANELSKQKPSIEAS